MTAESSVARWLEGHASKPPVAPDSLHPADEFPLATFSNPPSSTDSEIDADDIDIASLVHPPAPRIMDDQVTANQARRRSSSLAGASGPSRKDSRKHRRRRSDNILEEGDVNSSDSEHSDSSGRTESDNLELDDMSADGLEDDEETGLTGRDRRRRRRRKKRNTLLDQRIVPQGIQITKEEEKIANQNMIHSMLINAVLIGLW